MATGFNTQTGNGEYRLQFETDNKELFLLMQETARLCVDGNPQTNADSIRAMNDEELAEWMARTQIAAIKEVMNLLLIPYNEPDDLVETGKTEALEWLKQPAE